MGVTGIGDMALHFMLGHQNARLNGDITSLAQMLATGQVEDRANPITGDYLILGDIARSTRLLDAYDTVTVEAGIFLSTAQTALETVQRSAETLASDLMAAAQSGTEVGLNVAGQNAREAFRSIVSYLNTTVAGRAVFAGSGTNSAALADGDTILNELAAAVNGIDTEAALKEEIKAWFTDVGGGFETLGYLGETEDISPFHLNQTASAQFQVRADRDEFREMLADIAIAALAMDEAFGMSQPEQKRLLQDAGEDLWARLDGVTELRAEVGGLEARVEEAGVRNAAARAGLELSHAGLIEVDPYETATRLETTQTQLEMLYSVTARLSNLTLANYLG